MNNNQQAHLLELVDPEDPERVAPVRAGLLAETGRVADVAEGQRARLEPRVAVERAERLLRRRDQVLLLALARDLQSAGVVGREKQRDKLILR
jgi:hypothetical protein